MDYGKRVCKITGQDCQNFCDKCELASKNNDLENLKFFEKVVEELKNKIANRK